MARDFGRACLLASGWSLLEECGAKQLDNVTLAPDGQEWAEQGDEVQHIDDAEQTKRTVKARRSRCATTSLLICGRELSAKPGRGRGGDEALLSFQQPKNSPRDAKLFNVPTGLIRILNRDLIAAGIAKRDERGRTIDVHAMRHTFGTLLSKGGVAPRTAQAAMRHSSIDLTMSVYTDPKLLDVAGAMDSLPNLSLDHKPTAEPNVLSATGTTDSPPSQFAPKFALTSGKPSTNWSIPDRTAVDGGKPDRRMKNVASAMADKEIRPLSSSDKGRRKVGVTAGHLNLWLMWWVSMLRSYWKLSPLALND